MGVLADTLTEAGHDVTVLMPVIDYEQQNKTGLRVTKKIIMVPPDPRVRKMKEYEKGMINDIWSMEPSIFELTRVHDEAKITRRGEHIRLYLYSGVIEAASIPASIAAISTVYLELISGIIGEPNNPSYIPGHMSSTGDHMSFMERIRNTIETTFGPQFFLNAYRKEIHAIRSKMGPDFKDYEQLINDASFIITNANPYLDYPRPTLHKTVSIGGITVRINEEGHKLPKKWDTILNERKTTVLISFGSVMKAIFMPEEYMQTLLNVFKSMPDTTFIMKYEEEGATFADHLPNVHLSTWFPQKALLADPRVTVFVTHSGLGSINEVAHLGRPTLLIPIFADQLRNANMLARHGGAILLSKSDLKNPEKIKSSLETISNDKTYAQNAKRLSEMLQNQPVTAKELFIRHAEFAARFGRLPNLNPYATQLSFVQYHLLDVIAAILLVIFVVFLFLYKIVGLFLKFTGVKVKDE
ncbi:hypothetical protein OESDEN_12462 [Oesophagostomum dentatum]|uniref:glucuronosyltransferase n=1 Tax=Oesophagostomum dentatum TaxID=61180 RepID=A0A0B1SX54_OESDE|nr:hypothetical protein OESDEN_12462 [Oesophagostomum dentatum]